MTRKRFDILVVLALAIGGVVGYPWARVQYHLTLLRSPNARQAIESQQALTELGRGAVPAIVRFLRRSDKGTSRRLALHVLLDQQFGGAANASNDDVIALASHVAETDWDQEVQSLAIQWLARARPAGAHDLLRRILRHPDPTIRVDAAQALARFYDPTDVTRLAPLLRDPDPQVRQWGSVALGILTGDPPVFPRGDAPQERAEREARVGDWLARHNVDAEFADAVQLKATATGPPASDFSLPTLAHESLRLESFRGKPVLLNFWATWCPPCEQELPALAAIAKELGDDAVVLGVTQEFENTVVAERELRAAGKWPEHANDELERTGHNHGSGHLDPHLRELVAEKQREMIAATVRDKGLTYPVVIGNEAVGDAFGVHALPVSVLIDADGRIVRRFVGARHESAFLAYLTALR